MSAAAVQPPWYLTERAESLAVIALTEHPDVEITRHQEAPSGLDILAMVRRAGHPGGRFFGVAIEPRLARTSEQETHDGRAFHLPREKASLLRDVPFPTCLFLFTVDDDQGYWGWIQEPVLDPALGPRLRLHEQGTLSNLTTEQVNEIVSDVDRWYDERK